VTVSDHKVPQQEAIVESAVENAHFQRNASGFFKKRHLFGSKDHRALTVGEKISGRMDFSELKTVETRVLPPP